MEAGWVLGLDRLVHTEEGEGKSSDRLGCRRLASHTTPCMWECLAGDRPGRAETALVPGNGDLGAETQRLRG